MRINDTTKFIPTDLIKCPCWVLWKKEEDKDGRPTKCLYSANYNGRASSTNPKTWTTYEKALSTFERAPSGEYQGIGFVISEEYGYIFIDIDHCINESGELNNLAEDIVKSFDHSYIEVSQSGSGLHIITQGTIEKSFKNSALGVEMYNRARFIAMTGNALRPSEIGPEQSSIDYVRHRYGPMKRSEKTFRAGPSIPLNRSDSHIIEMAMKRERKFPSLWAGQWEGLYSSQSEADGALCTILAFWTDADPESIERLFRSSGLYREKWERADYRQRTISGAIAKLDETLSEYIQRKNREEADRFNEVYLAKW